MHWDRFCEPPDEPSDDDDCDDDESFEELLAHESIKPKANAKIVGKKRNFSFFIEPQVCAGQIILYSN